VAWACSITDTDSEVGNAKGGSCSIQYIVQPQHNNRSTADVPIDRHTCIRTQGGLPGVVDVNNDPGGDRAVDAGQILGQPLPLGTAGGVVNVGGQVDHMGGAHCLAVEEV